MKKNSIQDRVTERQEAWSTIDWMEEHADMYPHIAGIGSVNYGKKEK